MVGSPDLLPLCQCLALALEDCLTAVVAGLAGPADATAGAEAACDDRRDRRRIG